MFSVGECMFSDAEYTFTDAKHTFTDAKHKINRGNMTFITANKSLSYRLMTINQPSWSKLAGRCIADIQSPRISDSGQEAKKIPQTGISATLSREKLSAPLSHYSSGATFLSDL